MEEEKYSRILIEKYRRELTEKLAEYKGDEPIRLNWPVEFLNKVLFMRYGNLKIFAIPFKLVKKLDLSNVDFSGMDISGMNFKNTYGVKINPQKLAGEMLEDEDALCFIGKYPHKINTLGNSDSCDISMFVKHFMVNCVFENVLFTGPFNNTFINHCNFKGSVNATINPQELLGDLFMINKKMDLDIKKIQLPMVNCVFSDVEFDGSFDNSIIYGSDFTGSKGASIDISKLEKINIRGEDVIPIGGCVFNDANVYGEEKVKTLIKR